jgi:hypothetical protein
VNAFVGDLADIDVNTAEVEDDFAEQFFAEDAADLAFDGGVGENLFEQSQA